MKKLLLGSGGIRTEARLRAWRDECDAFLGDVREVLFVPYAVADWDSYVEKTKSMNLHVGRTVVGIHGFKDPIEAIHNAKALHMGGGNTFRLLHKLQEQKLLAPIRARVLKGELLYLGISAGANMACPSIKTTNDMPIVCPSGFDALGLVDFQINPHFTPGAMHYYENDQLIPYGGETREDRLREFHEMNTVPVLALTEGSMLCIEGPTITFKGPGFAKLLRPKTPPLTFYSGQEISL